VRGVQAGSRLSYPNIHRLPANAVITFNVASGNPSGGVIEVHEDGANGPLLGTVTVPPTGGWAKYQTLSVALSNPPGMRNLCLTFHGGAGELLRLDWFRFSHP